MRTRAPLLAVSLLVAGCAATPKAKPPTAPVAVVEAPAAEPAEAVGAPPATEMTRPLPMRFLLPHAGSLAVVDVNALRELGLHHSLRYVLSEIIAEDPKGCLDELLANTRRLVVSSEIIDMPKVTVVENALPAETVLDCLAASVPDAQAVQVGNLPGLRVAGDAVVTQLDGQLLVGNESGLRVLQGLPALDPPVEPPNPMHPDEDFMFPSGPKSHVRDVIPSLNLEPGVLVTAAVADAGGFSPIGRTAMEIRETPEGIEAFVHIATRQAPGEHSGAPPFGDPENLFEEARKVLLSRFEDEDHLRPIGALLAEARLEPHGDGVRVVLNIPAPRATVPLLEAAAQHELGKYSAVVEELGPDPGEPAQER